MCYLLEMLVLWLQKKTIEQYNMSRFIVHIRRVHRLSLRKTNSILCLEIKLSDIVCEHC